MKVLAVYVAALAFSLAGCGPEFTGLLPDGGGGVHLEGTPAADAGDDVEPIVDDAGRELEHDAGIVPKPTHDAGPVLEHDAGDVLEDAAAAPGPDSSSPGDDDAGDVVPPVPDAGRVVCVSLSACPSCGPLKSACCTAADYCGCTFGSGVCQ
jgi:hypothetical protein